MSQGNVIFLNGTSSAGKTSIAQALLKRTELPFIHLSVDQFILSVPNHYWAANDATTRDATFTTIIRGYHHCLAALVTTGNYVIADHVLQERVWWQECARLLAPFDAYLVEIFCPLDVLEQRELLRGDREIGLARFQYDRVYGPGIHDVRVDTSRADAATCAADIHAAVASGTRPSAFRRITAEDQL